MGLETGHAGRTRRTDVVVIRGEIHRQVPVPCELGGADLRQLRIVGDLRHARIEIGVDADERRLVRSERGGFDLEERTLLSDVGARRLDVVELDGFGAVGLIHWYEPPRKNVQATVRIDATTKATALALT